MRVMLVEDDPFARRVLVKTLEKWGYDVVTAEDGETALKMLGESDAPRLLLVDWMMPGISGPEFCRRVRLDDRGRLVYIIMLTAKDGVDALVAAMEAGADDYTTKSFDVRELNVRLRAGERIVKLEDSLHRLATRDALTEIWNRAAILDLLGRELGRARRDKTSTGVIMVNVDHFKRINDLYGHAGGDAVLVEIAARLRGGLRGYDGVGRYGGEEFLVVLPGADVPGVAEVAERIRQGVVRGPVVFGKEQLEVTASYGTCCCAAGQTMEAEALIKRADEALYFAKDNGRDRVIAHESLSPSSCPNAAGCAK